MVFDSTLSFHNHISSLSKTSYYHIKDLRRIRSSINQNTASIIATSLVHSKLDYCNSLFLNLPASEINRLQHIQNDLARAVFRLPRCAHVTPLLHSLHWLKIPERITYKVTSLTYKAIQFNEPPYLANLLSLQMGRSTRSSNLVTLSRPSNPSRSTITDRSFHFFAPKLWNTLPSTLRQPHPTLSSLLTLSADKFHTLLKTHLFALSYPNLPGSPPH